VLRARVGVLRSISTHDALPGCLVSTIAGGKRQGSDRFFRSRRSRGAFWTPSLRRRARGDRSRAEVVEGSGMGLRSTSRSSIEAERARYSERNGKRRPRSPRSWERSREGKLLVTSATGFSGHLVERLVSTAWAESRLRIWRGRVSRDERARRRKSFRDRSGRKRLCLGPRERLGGLSPLARKVSHQSGGRRQLYKVRSGTSILCRAARKAGVDRIVSLRPAEPSP
jgi:hypothetical protein